MKRFYKTAVAEPTGGGHAIKLDGRGIKTPARAELIVPTSALATTIAAEWDAQGETIEPRSMPLTGLANAAIDRVAPDQAAFAASLVAYAESDLLCYRADAPAKLVARQAEHWDPLLAWACDRYDVHFEVTEGILHKAQPAETTTRLGQALCGFDPFHLAPLYPLVTIAGSLIVALAIVEGQIDVETAFATAHLEEMWQVEHWGEDELATRARESRRADFKAAARFLALLM